MEEASVAGESPDRSKQRESSAQPTSGSAGPVPEARSGARDPRLSLTGDAEASDGAEDSGTSGASGASERRGGVDTATRVLSVRDLVADGEGAGDSGDGEGAQASGKGQGGRDAGTAGEPGRSVQAEKADGAKDDAGAADDQSGDATAPERDGEAEAAARSGEAEAGSADRSGDADRSAEAAEVRGAGKTVGTGTGSGSAEGAAGDAAPGAGDREAGKAGEASRDSDSGDEGDASGDARLREAVAARVDTADAPDTPDSEKSPAGSKADDAGRAKGVRETDASQEAKGTKDMAEADDAERGGTARGAAPATADADAADSDADDAADGDGDRSTDTSSGTADSRPGKAARPAKGAGDTEDAEDVVEADGATADDSADDDAEDTGGADDSPKSGPTTAPESKTPRGDGDPQGSADDRKPGGKPSVDQPTAMLRVGGAAKPRVDQPTTMLKLGGERKQDERDQQGKQGKEKQDTRLPESDAERTSKFVALKPLDLPQLPEPKPAQPATPRPLPADATAAVPQIGPERTTQQPLPPKPPLDLLAELTNTPPPPETPMRTLVRRVKIWTPLAVLLVIVFAIVQAVRPLPAPTLALSAKDTYTFDGDQVKLPWPNEGQGWMEADGVGTMDHFGEQNPVPIGSVAKTMTAYIILRDHPLKPGEEGPKIEIDPTAEKEGGYHKVGESTLDSVKAGDSLTEKQALSAVMIPSANNIARLLARWDAGSEEAFVEKMNDTAKELGMTNTTYTDPSGLKETTVSTAEDQVKLGNAAMRIPAMVAITSAASWTDPTGKYWSNYNELPYTIGAIGIKTGSTTKAGGNLLFAAHKKVGGRTVTIVGAILGQHKPPILTTANAVSKTALLAAQDVPTSAKILKKGDVVGYVDDRLGGHTPVVVTKDVTAVGWAGLKVKLSLVAKDVPSVGKVGDEVGTLTVGDGSDGAVKVPVALQEDLVEPGFTAKLTRLG
jgi:D-alanyl-D-alanine carboxypeptidase